MAFPVAVTTFDFQSEERRQFQATCYELSDEGMALFGSDLPAVKTRVQLQWRLPRLAEPAPLGGRIVWMTDAASGPQRCGVAFDRGLGLNVLSAMLKGLRAENKRGPDRRRGERRGEGSASGPERRLYDRRTRMKFLANAWRFARRATEVKAAGNYFWLKCIDSASGARVRMDGRELIMLCSNNYLGLADHPKVVEAAEAALKRFGVGSGASRLLAGTSRLHQELEDAIAEFKGREAAVLFSAGFLANFGVISALVQKEDAILIDQKVHASIVDGCLHTGAVVRVFRHNDPVDLEKKLNSCRQIARKLVIVDGVYSMDGDIADLPEIHELVQRYGAMLMVDDAHATGVIGETGRGTEEYYGNREHADLAVGTFSKALGSAGGYVCGSRDLALFLKHASRPFIFNTSLPPVVCAAALAGLRVLQSEPWRVRELTRKSNYFRTSLQEIGFNTGLSETAIVPVMIGRENVMEKITRFLLDQGVFVGPVGRPAVKRTEARLRLSLMATHEQRDIEFVVSLFAEAYKRFGPFDAEVDPA